MTDGITYQALVVYQRYHGMCINVYVAMSEVIEVYIHIEMASFQAKLKLYGDDDDVHITHTAYKYVGITQYIPCLLLYNSHTAYN